MRRKFWFGLMPLVCGMALALAAPAVAPADGCAAEEEKGEKKGKEKLKVWVCPLYFVMDQGATKVYYAQKCKTPPEFVSLVLGKDDPYPGSCSDATKKNCIEIDERRPRQKWKHKKARPRTSAEVFQGPKDGYTTTELPDREALAYLELDGQGKSKVKVQIHQAEVTKAKAVKKLIAVGVEVVTTDEPTLTIRHSAIVAKDFQHNVENVYTVRYGTNFTLPIILDGNTVVRGLKKK